MRHQPERFLHSGVDFRVRIFACLFGNLQVVIVTYFLVCSFARGMGIVGWLLGAYHPLNFSNALYGIVLYCLLIVVGKLIRLCANHLWKCGFSCSAFPFSLSLPPPSSLSLSLSPSLIYTQLFLKAKSGCF